MEFDPHYAGLLAAYAAALLGWCVLFLLDGSRERKLWSVREAAFARPWFEVTLALLAACGVIGVGQLWSRGWLIPERGPASLFAATINQALIFSPMMLLLLARRQSPSTAWIRRDRVASRIVTGIMLAAVGLAAYAVARGDLRLWPLLAVEAIDLPAHLDELMQVFCEDLAIAILVVRIAAATRRKWIPASVVAVLFAAGHIPAMLSDGQPLAELLHLVLDAGLAFGVIAVVQRSSDIWWFWIVHYTMDMTQFAELAPVN